MIPDLLIKFGPRSILALIGIVTLFSGVWYADRTWDEKGSKAYARAKKKGNKGEEIVIPREDLDQAFPFPIAFLVGWILFAISYIFPTDGSTKIDLSSVNLLAIGFSLALSVIASVPMADAVQNRNAKSRSIGSS